MLARQSDRTNTAGRYDGLELRLNLVAAAFVLAMLLLCIQFWRLQVVGKSHFQKMAEENTVSSQRLVSNRGIIYGRNDTIVANNRASADIVYIPGPAPNAAAYPSKQHQAVCSMLETLIGISAQELLDKIRNVKREPFTQITVKRDVSRADLVRIEESAYALPGVLAVVRPQRRYPYGETAGQVLGYLGVIRKAELQPGYSPGDLVGRSGLERKYESTLHGHDGNMVVTKYAWGKPQILTDERGIPFIAKEDSRGNVIEQNYRIEPESGNSLYLTLDMDLQQFSESLLQGNVGAIVVLDAETGGVLTLASSPMYDPSVFVTRGRSQDRVDLLMADRPNPMVARAFRENYPPGSVFKIMLASAALEEGIITQDSTFFCPGFFQLPNVKRLSHCWQRRGHGEMTVVEALAFSCDVFFYNTGYQLGVDKISEWGRKMGLGHKTGIDLPSEVPGIMPDRAWKAARHAGEVRSEQNWYDGDTINLSIGQGGATTTPLQNAVLMATIINGGYRITPHLNRTLDVTPSERFLSDETVEIVRTGMRLCIEKAPPAPTGTGRLAQVAGIDLIGKTGSAQVTSLEVHEQYATEADIPYKFRDHAWFVAGVLDQEPKISICILIEHGHHGSSVAAPLAKKIVKFFYEKKDTPSVQLASEGIDN